ncbi:hypothetical protein DFI02_106211 [Rhizobium sp. PP-F2F-G20b]|nr:hypothetical protein DFI02_106211 [Rhizobium sp. PP-F2F-G20b]
MLSARDLGRHIDDLHRRGANLLEGPQSVAVSNLGAEQARGLASVCRSGAFTCSIADEAGTRWDEDDVDEGFAPFRLVIGKPTNENGILCVLTEHGFRTMLAEPDHGEPRWWVAGLQAPIRTWSTLFLPWGESLPKLDPIPTKNPRYFVREYSAERSAPNSVGRWLLRDPERDLGVSDACRDRWAEVASDALTLCLPNEIDPESGALKFRGPSRLVLERPSSEQMAEFVTGRGFLLLQNAIAWVFENERETETRHTLLAAELARSAALNRSTTAVLEENLYSALEGARIAYEMHLMSVGNDTLKALADLRKAVTEEIGKTTEATRQTSAAVASALAVGLGLLAAKTTATVSPGLVMALMCVAVVYVLMVAVSGGLHVFFQRKARRSWQERLYRFLPKIEYKQLVTDPITSSEWVFYLICALGGGSVLVLAFIVIFQTPMPSP